MENLIINKNQLFELLCKSYEEGYNGYLELRDDYVNSLINNYLSSKQSLEFGDISLNSSPASYSTTEIIASNETVSMNTISTEQQTVFSFNY
jgi:hypothetical protein